MLIVKDACKGKEEYWVTGWGNTAAQDWKAFYDTAPDKGRVFRVWKGCQKDADGRTKCQCVVEEGAKWKPPSGTYGGDWTSNTKPSDIIKKCGLHDPFGLSPRSETPQGWGYEPPKPPVPPPPPAPEKPDYLKTGDEMRQKYENQMNQGSGTPLRY